MYTVKNVLFFGLLLAVLCGVYLSLNRSPEATLPKGLSGDTSPPKIEIPGLTAGAPSNTSDSGGIPGFPSQPPPMNTPPNNTGGAAPPFQPPTTGGPTITAPPWTAGGGSDAMPPPPPASPPPPRDSSYPPGVRDPFDHRSASESSISDRSTSPVPSPPADRSTAARIEQTMLQVKLDVEKYHLSEALLNLTQLYGNPDLPASQAREVTLLLDKMGAKVIYSREHWLEGAYRVQAGDTLESIADRYRVPAMLLARINAIRDPQNVPPGTELKVLKGPFSAQISPDRSEMTLMLDGRYAGRFNVVLSNDLSHAMGMWAVRDKRAPSAAPGNGTGRQWIELFNNQSGSISMQGTNDTRVTTGRDSRNTIWLSEQDMDDVFGILSVGSSVIIQR